MPYKERDDIHGEGMDGYTPKRSEKSKDTLNIAFLVCDEPSKPVLDKHGGFNDLLHKLLEPLLKKEHPDLKLVVEGYDVVYKREYPSRKQLESVDCVCISGSFVEDAYADTAWMARLGGFMVYLHDEHPRIRQIGICFGHQVIARAWGAKVEPNKLGWEIGSTELKLTHDGKSLLGTPGKHEDVLRIQQVHSDHVTSVPEGFKLLASSEKVDIQSLVKYYDDKEGKREAPAFTHDTKLPPKPYSMMHILTMQGHPEWGPEVIDPLVDEFLREGKIDEELAKTAKKYTKKDDNGEIFGRAMMRMLGVAWQETHDLVENGKTIHAAQAKSSVECEAGE